MMISDDRGPRQKLRQEDDKALTELKLFPDGGKAQKKLPQAQEEEEDEQHHESLTELKLFLDGGEAQKKVPQAQEADEEEQQQSALEQQQLSSISPLSPPRPPPFAFQPIKRPQEREQRVADSVQQQHLNPTSNPPLSPPRPPTLTSPSPSTSSTQVLTDGQAIVLYKMKQLLPAVAQRYEESIRKSHLPRSQQTQPQTTILAKNPIAKGVNQLVKDSLQNLNVKELNKDKSLSLMISLIMLDCVLDTLPLGDSADAMEAAVTGALRDGSGVRDPDRGDA